VDTALTKAMAYFRKWKAVLVGRGADPYVCQFYQKALCSSKKQNNFINKKFPDRNIN